LNQEFEPKLNPKKKIEEKFMALLKTNDKCEGAYNGVTLTTEKGVVSA